MRALVMALAAVVLGVATAWGQSRGGDGPWCSRDAACQVDTATFVGWRVFETHCAGCHGQSGVGSRFAPELGSRMRGMTQREFSVALREGYRGLQGRMTPRADNRDVARYVDELWSYLRARASGDLGPGPLERFSEN